MKRLKWQSLLPLAVVGASFVPLCAAEPDWLTLVGLYPQPATVTALSELAIMLWLQNVRTAQDVARAQEETTRFAGDLHLGATATAAPRPIEIGDFPRTAAIRPGGSTSRGIWRCSRRPAGSGTTRRFSRRTAPDQAGTAAEPRP
jgi:hypothetical protein